MMNAKKITKSYAYIDIIGIKKALMDGSGVELLNRLWKRTDGWAFSCEGVMGKPLNKEGFLYNAMPYVTTFNDSILIDTEMEFEIKHLYELADLYREMLKKNEFSFYTILNQDWEIQPPKFHAMGGTKGNYQNITGAGAAWGNIYIGDSEIRHHKTEWIGKYFYYVIDDKSGKNIIQKYPPKTSHDFIGVNNESRVIIAIE